MKITLRAAAVLVLVTGTICVAQFQGRKDLDMDLKLKVKRESDIFVVVEIIYTTKLVLAVEFRRYVSNPGTRPKTRRPFPCPSSDAKKTQACYTVYSIQLM